jgi:hypothetical protein
MRTCTQAGLKFAGLSVLLAGLTSCTLTWPPLSAAQSISLRQNMELFTSALRAISTLAAIEPLQSRAIPDPPTITCPSVTLDPSNAALAFSLTFASDCTLTPVALTRIQGSLGVVFSESQSDVEINFDSLMVAGEELTGSAGLAMNAAGADTLLLTGNFRIAIADLDEVRGIVTLTYSPDGLLSISNGFWLFENSAVEFEVADPTSNLPGGQVVIDLAGSNTLIPSSGRIAFRDDGSRYVVTFEDSTPIDGSVTIKIDNQPTFHTTLPYLLD